MVGRTVSAYGFRIRIQKAKRPAKSEETSSFAALDIFFREEEFYCSLDVLCGALEISESQFLKEKKIPAVISFTFNPGPEFACETNIDPQQRLPAGYLSVGDPELRRGIQEPEESAVTVK